MTGGVGGVMETVIRMVQTRLLAAPLVDIVMIDCYLIRPLTYEVDSSETYAPDAIKLHGYVCLLCCCTSWVSILACRFALLSALFAASFMEQLSLNFAKRLSFVAL